MICSLDDGDPTNILRTNKGIPLIGSQICPVVQQPGHFSRIRASVFSRWGSRDIGIRAHPVLSPDEESLGNLLAELWVGEGECDGLVCVQGVDEGEEVRKEPLRGRGLAFTEEAD